MVYFGSFAHKCSKSLFILLILFHFSQRIGQSLDVYKFSAGVEISKLCFLADGSGAGSNLHGVFGKILDIVLEKLVVAVFVELSLGETVLPLFNQIVGLSAYSFGASFEYGSSLLSEFEVDYVGAARGGQYLLVESDYFELCATRDEL